MRGEGAEGIGVDTEKWAGEGRGKGMGIVTEKKRGYSGGRYKVQVRIR